MTVLRPAPSLGLVESADTVYIAFLPDGPITVLDGVARLIWDAALEGARESVPDRVAELMDGAVPDEARAVVAEFVSQLVAAGILVPGDL
ncbi:PqqD family protein [Microbacterium lacus]|uniref:PqqD family peptide modification chaperone n=1 Tax=Microbacterium lacus TaxID=415217 RepID=UPI003850719D